MNKIPVLVVLIVALLGFSFSVFGQEVVCPKDPDFNESAWVLVSVERVSGAEYMVRRKFFYQDDPLLRVVKKESSGCSGEMLSFIVRGREELIVKGISNSLQHVFFLQLQDGTWKSGVSIAPLVIADDTLAVLLYNAAGREVARREFSFELLIPR